jgi:N-acetylglutamate synthase-like GNAT family acetyltransferase
LSNNIVAQEKYIKYNIGSYCQFMKEGIIKLVSESGLDTSHIDQVDDDWVVENENGQIVGYTGIEKRGERIYLQSLVVKKGYRKIGIGSKLVEKAFNSINEGEELIGLTLFWNNDFYRNCGFTQLDAKEIKKNDDVAAREKHKYCVAWGRKK